MDIPPETSERWKDIINSSNSFNLNFFPLKLLLARQKLELMTSEDPQKTTEKCVSELYQLLERNKHLPNVQKDIEILFGKKRSFWKRLLRRH